MRIVVLFAVFLLLACDGTERKASTETPKLNSQLLELVEFVNDSVATCHVWLAQDSQRRQFFPEDSAAEILIDRFTHDQIVTWFQSLDTTDLVVIRPYLNELKLSTVANNDSITQCASAINSVAFSHEGTEAVLLFVHITKAEENLYTLLLERASMAEQWYVADTLSHQINQR